MTDEVTAYRIHTDEHGTRRARIAPPYVYNDEPHVARASDGEYVARLMLNPAEACVYVITQRMH